MKRLLIFAAVLSGVVSCELYGGYITQNTQQQLQKYTLDAFSGHVLMPVMMAELAVDFDAYLSLTDEDKAKDFRFYGNIRNPEENTYQIELDDLSCTLRTGGRSIWDDGAQWTFLSFGAHTDLNGQGGLYCSVSEKIILDSAPVAPADTSVRIFSMSYGDDPVGMVLCSYKDGQFEWNVGSRGVNVDGDGYVAEYTTGTDGVKVTRRYNQSLSGYEYICDGDFLVTVFKDNEPIDMCKAVFEPGLKTQFVSSN